LEGNGKNNFYRADFNIGGPLGKNWFYNAGGFYRYAEGARYPGYPLNNGGQFRGNVVKKYATGSLKLYAKYLNDRNGWFEFTPTVGYSDPKPAPGFSAYSSVLSPLVRQTFPINETGRTGTYNNKDLIHSKDRSVGLNWEQRFGEGWTFNNAMRYSDKSANWNTNAVVYPLDMTNLVSYAIINTLGRPGTYSFRGLTSGKELLSVTSFSGFDFTANKSSLPGQEVAPNSLFFEPLLYQDNDVKELLDQFSLTKRIKNMSFTAGGFYGRSKVDRINGIAGVGLGTIQDRPELVGITITNPDKTVTHVTNSQGLLGVGGGISFNKATQEQLAFFFGHNWQINPALNLDWGVRYEHMSVKGHNSPGVNTQSTTGGKDADPLTLYDNSVGTTPVTYLFDKKVSTFSYSAGLNYKINNKFALYGRFSEGNKAPDLDMYFNANTEFTSKNLNPIAQKVQQAEIGVKAKLNNLNLFVTPFYSVLSNVANVQTFQNADQTFYSPPFVYNKYRTMGVEVESDYSFAKHFNVRGVLTLQKAKAVDFNTYLANGFGPADDSLVSFSGNETDNSARSIINITPSYNRDKFYAQLTWSYMGKRQANVANAFSLPSFSQFNFSTGYDVYKNFQLGLVINNLINTYGVMSWSRPGSFLEALDRQGFTKEMYAEAVRTNRPYSTVAIAPRSYFVTATFKF
jgi:outer membrane receptor protein involved in Fe transport